MRWDTYDTEILTQAGTTPGGFHIVEALFRQVDIQPGMKVLDISVGPGIFASVLAKEHDVEVTTIVDGADEESAAESLKTLIGVGDKVSVIPGKITALPVPSEEFNLIFSIGVPFNPSPSAVLAKEIYRVLAPDGTVAFAGPSGTTNYTPGYFETPFADCGNVKVKTPAYTALMFAREGFHILNAEFFGEAWDHWTEWLKNAPPEIMPDSLKNAINEDGGRWLSLGLIVLKKPPKPTWAM